VNQGDDAVDDDEEYGGKASLVAEAFAGDDVVADFKKEKEDVRNAARPKVDLAVSDMPGWGDWGGKNLVANPARKRRKRKHVRMPSPPPRKDDSVGNVIMSEKGHESARQAQV
jgi:U3 small nucleolar RNA-associated protein 14